MSPFEAWLRLANIQISARLANELLNQFGSPEALFEASSRTNESLPGCTAPQASRISDPSFHPTNVQLATMDAMQIDLITRVDERYPKRLAEIPDPPIALFVRGELIEKDQYSVGLVGSRRATPYGRSVTTKMATELARAGLAVVSGGALGIDSVAHRAAFEAGGRTIAILGCGLDVEYPKENQPLFQAIIDNKQGAIISEFPLGSAPEPWHFPMRNRLISGISLGVVVIEAGQQSGALLTATSAAEQGRDVMAVPGNVDREASKGTNELIKDGAILVEDASDVTRALGILVMETEKPKNAQQSLPMTHLPEQQQRLMNSLSLTPKHIDALAADVRLTASEVAVQLTLMELNGIVRRLPGNCYIRVL